MLKGDDGVVMKEDIMWMVIIPSDPKIEGVGVSSGLSLFAVAL